jgi:hypothetical protein
MYKAMHTELFVHANSSHVPLSARARKKNAFISRRAVSMDMCRLSSLVE